MAGLITNNCHICDGTLLPHPLFKKSGAKYCPRHGDFFIYAPRGKEPETVFCAVGPVRQKVWMKPAGRPPIRVKCIETREIFPSIKGAARAMGVSPCSLSRHINGYPGYSHAGGYTFKKLPAN